MKVFFAPNYLYLNLPVFEAVVSNLKKKKITSYILRISGNTNTPADDLFTSAYFSKRQLNIIEPPIRSNSSYREGFLGKISFIISALRNLSIVRRLLEQERPDLLVVGSDLGSLHVRFLIDACLLYNIPVVILYVCDIPDYIQEYSIFKIFSFCYSYTNRFIFKSSALSFLRALLFVSTTPGKYALKAPICVISEDIRRKLISRGIADNRIIVTGMPLLNCETDTLLRDASDDLGTPANYRLVVFFSECIEHLYGESYARKCYAKLAEIPKRLPDNVLLIVKQHPLESTEMETLITKLFDQPNCKVIKTFNTDKLIALADLSLAHFSRVLITAAMMGKAFLSINVMGDRTRTFVLAEESEVMEITSYEVLSAKINDALEKLEVRAKIHKISKNIAGRFANSDSLEKVVSVLLASAASRYQ